MTTQELDALEALCDGAAPGPWTVDNASGNIKAHNATVAYDTWAEREGAFIAASRTAMPQLIADVRRLTGENASMMDNYNDLSRDYRNRIAEHNTLRDRFNVIENDLINASMNLEIMTERYESAERDLRKDCTTCEHKGRSGLSEPCLNCQGCGYASWEWRGPQPAKEDASEKT